jgi:hypothetical protein
VPLEHTDCAIETRRGKDPGAGEDLSGHGAVGEFAGGLGVGDSTA